MKKTTVTGMPVVGRRTKAGRAIGFFMAGSALGLGSFFSVLNSTVLAAASDSLVMEEVIITAQKREQNIQNVGISVTSLSGRQLTQLGYTSTADIIAQTPSLHMLSYSPSLTVFNIRGVSQNDFADHYEPPIAVFMDEAYISSQGAVNTTLFDMERVEVLRGPQGTLFGRNATGGAIQYISRKPTENFEGYGQMTLGEYGQHNFEGAVSGPLNERVTARLALSSVNNDGWIKNRIGADLNANKDLAGRLQFNLKAGDNTNILLNFHGSHNRDTSGGYSHQALYQDADGLGTVVPDNVDIYGTCNGCDLLGYKNPGNSPWNQAYDRIGFLHRDIAGVTAKISSDLGWGNITSITDILYMKKVFGSDSDASPNDLLLFDSYQKLHQYSEEFRLSGKLENTRWVAGVYLLYIKTEDQASAQIGTLYNPPFLSVADYTLTTKSGAVFGQVEQDLTKTLTAIAGIRLTSDQKEMNYRLTDNFGSDIPFNNSLYPGEAKKTYRNVSAKFELDWKPQKDWLLYASINRGTKAGSYSAPIFAPVIIAELPHGQEVLTAYEAGTKTTLFDGKLRFNASAFFYNYKGYQAFFLAGLSQSIANRDAKIHGGEVEIASSPFEGLDLSLGLSHLHGTVYDVKLPFGRITDRDMPMTPGLTLNGLVRYSWPLLGGKMAIQGDATYTGAYNFYVVNPPQAEEGKHFVANARISFQSGDGHWEGAVFVKNLGNEKYRQYTNDISPLSIGLDAYAPPRWFAASIAYHWN